MAGESMKVNEGEAAAAASPQSPPSSPAPTPSTSSPSTPAQEARKGFDMAEENMNTNDEALAPAAAPAQSLASPSLPPEPEGMAIDNANEEEGRIYSSSFSSDGEEFHLNDIVRIYDRRFTVPHIGRIVKMWEGQSSGTKEALICWFLRHKEVKPNEDDNPKELFLVAGKEQGVTNEIDMDSIVGKCKAVCTSKDPRNSEPSISDIENADFFFSHAYDVDIQQTVPVEDVVDKIGPDVIFNTQEWLIAVRKIKGQAHTKKSASSPLLDSKKRSRDEEIHPSIQKKKIIKKEDVKKVQMSTEEAPKQKKIKVVDGKTLIQKEKVKLNSVSKKEEFEPSKRQTLKSEVPSKLSKPQTIDIKGSASVDKDSAPRKVVLEKVDTTEQAKPTNKRLVKQVEDESRTQDVPEGVGKQKMEHKVDVSLRVEKSQTEKYREMDYDLSVPKLEKSGSKGSTAERIDSIEADRNEESISKILNQTRLSSSIDTEKKLISAAETTKLFEKRKIFKELPWEENLQRGIPAGKVVHLQNVDPSMTSADIQETFKSVFQGVSDARVLPKESICPTAQAIVIFDTKLSADNALSAMERDCLLLERRWPIIASKVKESADESKFPGHLALEKLKLGRNLVTEDYKKAVATSHCSQPNTIEFEMAMEWRQLQEIIQTCRIELFKKQRKELYDFRNHAQKPKQDRV
ncbi:hypothetical protein KP509_16G054700 [Ceratopteris richardii]|uniref:BAH domain-containing protein n=1 Tax=Ceratopteris richardii TaxID=49495 RepID=A0A8T2T2M3_CERRI|nr:hypothetical protein KP509_16G054700 [Ceratopteris richardii]